MARVGKGHGNKEERARQTGNEEAEIFSSL